MVEIKINNIDKTSDILFETFRISDYINQQVDTCSFTCKSFKPLLNQEIQVKYGDDTIYGGVIVKVETEVRKGENIYKVTCKDYSQYLNRRLVSERYINKTVKQIIDDLLDEYATDFTSVNVVGAITKRIWDSGNQLPTFTNHIISGTNTLTPTLVSDYINLSYSMSGGGGNRYLYVDMSSITDYVVQSGDYLEYDIYWETAGDIKIGVDLTCSDSTALRGVGAVDQNGLGAHPSTDLSSRASSQWYHRKISLASLVDKTIQYYDITCENDNAGTFVARIKNIRITDGGTEIKSELNPVTQITFNRLNLSQCIQALAELLNYSWYVDYEKDIHFFAENDEEAPFNLTETAGNHAWESLKLIDDFSQIRNQIYIIGGDSEAEPRTEEYVADGEQRQFPLAYKYSQITRVRIVGDPDLTVGIDGQDEDTAFNVFWSGNKPSQYIRFKDSNYPDASDVVEITGVPLFPVLVKVPDVSSIAQYGLYEFKIKDPQITSRADAIARGTVELQAYADSIEEGSFTTDKYGLRSGQTIRITIGDTDEDFIIQSVSMNMKDPFNGKWSVKLATVRTLGIIRFLQKYLRIEDDVTEGEVLLELQQFEDESASTDSVDDLTTRTSQDYYWGDDTAQAYDSYWDFSTYD
jgi:hypothetical protein